MASHGLDFADARQVFEGLTLTYEDDRFDYGEQRLVTLGLLAGEPVSIVHSEKPGVIRFISFRKATKNEQKVLFQSIEL